MTVRQLLSHTSGLADHAQAPQFIATIKATPSTKWTRPGTSRAWSNGPIRSPGPARSTPTPTRATCCSAASSNASPASRSRRPCARSCALDRRGVPGTYWERVEAGQGTATRAPGLRGPRHLPVGPVDGPVRRRRSGRDASRHGDLLRRAALRRGVRQRRHPRADAVVRRAARRTARTGSACSPTSSTGSRPPAIRVSGARWSCANPAPGGPSPVPSPAARSSTSSRRWSAATWPPRTPDAAGSRPGSKLAA